LNEKGVDQEKFLALEKCKIIYFLIRKYGKEFVTRYRLIKQNCTYMASPSSGAGFPQSRTQRRSSLGVGWPGHLLCAAPQPHFSVH